MKSLLLQVQGTECMTALCRELHFVTPSVSRSTRGGDVALPSSAPLARTEASAADSFDTNSVVVLSDKQWL